MSIELDTKVDGKDKGRHAQIKIDDFMSASTKPLITGESPDSILTPEQIKKISPVAWQHINFYGRFEFSDLGASFNVDEFMQTVDFNKLAAALKSANISTNDENLA